MTHLIIPYLACGLIVTLLAGMNGKVDSFPACFACVVFWPPVVIATLIVGMIRLANELIGP